MICPSFIGAVFSPCVPQPSGEEEVVAVLLKKICNLFGIKSVAEQEPGAPAADASSSAPLKWIWMSFSVGFSTDIYRFILFIFFFNGHKSTPLFNFCVTWNQTSPTFD